MEGRVYDQQPWRGLRGAVRVYAGWGFSQAFYWDEAYKQLGSTSREDFLEGFWEDFFLDERFNRAGRRSCSSRSPRCAGARARHPAGRAVRRWRS